MMDLAEVSPAAERARRCQEYLEALEEERRKIEVFQRELPLSLDLVTQAIESYRQQMAAEMVVRCAAASEREGEVVLDISSEGAPVLEEFIPIKRSSSEEDDDDEEPGDRRRRDHRGNGGHNDDEDSSSTGRQKPQETTSENVPDWLRSVQLWSLQPDPHPFPREEEQHVSQEMDALRPSVIAVEPKKSTGAFHPFQPQNCSPPPPAPPPSVEAAPAPAPAPVAPVTSSNSETRCGGVGSHGGGGNEKGGHPHRKSRRCWSPELHRRFLNALQQLGGSDVATPKQIRELMKVDSLTNDEVKSHLQKYRLHSRRPSPTSHPNSSGAPPQQVVFVGGIWVPPPEYAAAVAAAAGTEGNHPPCPPAEIYAPVASVPTPKQQQQQKQRKHHQQLQQQRSFGGRDEKCVADDGAVASDSPATSSSSRTNTSGLAGRRR